jgi:hypothetical protein
MMKREIYGIVNNEVKITARGDYESFQAKSILPFARKQPYQHRG